MKRPTKRPIKRRSTPITLSAISLIVVLLTFFIGPLFALPQHDPVSGGIALVPVRSSAQVRFRQHPVMVLGQAGRYIAVVGIPLTASPGEKHLETPDGRVAFTVHHRDYKVQRLTLTDNRMVNPLPQDLDRIAGERSEMNRAFTLFSRPDTIDTEFRLPVQGPVSSPFGLRRIFNDQPRNPHSGLDIAAPEGDIITAPSPGRVVASGDYFFNGNTILLDHGQGLISMYCHMSSVEVALGDTVAAGQAIGRVGRTGRVTGAHLHWSVSLNNSRVNPNLFLKEPL